MCQILRFSFKKCPVCNKCWNYSIGHYAHVQESTLMTTPTGLIPTPIIWINLLMPIARADQGSVKAPCQYRLAMGSINEGSDFSMHSATKFKCNYVVIDVVHSGIKMTGSYFSEFRWDEKCCNSLHEYKDYSKTHPLPQYAQMINFIPITQCSPKWYCDACRTARAWRQRMAQRCPVNRQHRVFFYMGSLGF